jgi:hypothetical protein
LKWRDSLRTKFNIKKKDTRVEEEEKTKKEASLLLKEIEENDKN